MREGYVAVGAGDPWHRFEIEPGIDVWEHPWGRDPDGRYQLGGSPMGPFRYLDLYSIVAEGRRTDFAVEVGSWDSYTFYRKV